MPFLKSVVSVLILGASCPMPQEPSVSASDQEQAEVTLDYSVPFRVVDGRIYVDVLVNDKGPFTFAIDTGAGGLGRADISLVNTLKLPFVGDDSASDGVSVKSVPTVRVERLEIGGFAIEGMEVMARDYSGRMSPEMAISGIIGRDFFADGTLTIDYGSMTVSFTRGGLLDPADPENLHYEHPFRVPVRIGEDLHKTHLDTGANVEIVMPKALYSTVSDIPLAAAADATLTNNNISTEQGVIKGPIRLGSAEFSDVPVRVSDRFPEMVIGSRILQQNKIIIDQRNKLVAIRPLTAPKQLYAPVALEQVE